MAIEFAYPVGVAALPKVHSDPFDRLLAAQALAEGLTLVSADDVFVQYWVSVLDVRR